MRAGCALFLLAFAPVGLLQAGPPEAAPALQIDSHRSRTVFWIRPLWIKRIEGVFPVLEGGLKPDSGGMAHVEINIDARAVQMDSGSQVRWAQSEQFFDVEHHPTIHFRSDPVPRERLFTTGFVSGTVTLRGITQPVRFDLAPASCDQPGFNCPVLASGELSRSQFGMDSHRLAMGDIVHLDFTLWLRRGREAAP